MEIEISKGRAQYFSVLNTLNGSCNLRAPTNVHNQPGIYGTTCDAKNHKPCQPVKSYKECLLTLVGFVRLSPRRPYLSFNNDDQKDQKGVWTVGVQKIRPRFRAHVVYPSLERPGHLPDEVQ